MRRTLLAFFGLAFVIYWLSTADLPREQQAMLEPVLPSLIPVTSPSTSSTAARPDTGETRSPASTLRTWLKDEAARMGRVDPDPARTLKRLKQHAQGLTARELQLLKDTALDRSMDGDQRFLSVYTIGLARSRSALSLLMDISRTRIPPTANDRAYSDEVVIRSQALEAAAKRLPRAEAVHYLRDILKNTSDPVLARRAGQLLSRR